MTDSFGRKLRIQCVCCKKWNDDNECDINHICPIALTGDRECYKSKVPKSLHIRVKTLMESNDKLEREVERLSKEITELKQK